MQREPFCALAEYGHDLSGAEMAPRDVDEDYDYIILHISDDPAARKKGRIEATSKLED